MTGITFVVPVGDSQIYENIFAASPLFASGRSDLEVLPKQGYLNAGQAFNKGIDEASHDLIVFAHQDVYLPGWWADDFQKRVQEAEAQHEAIGVLGCIGVAKTGALAGHIYRHDRELRPEQGLPAAVETLDELLVSFRKSTGLRFDEEVPGFFYYGVDICLQAAASRLVNLAVDCPCFHQAKTRKSLPKSFGECQAYMLRKWKSVLPVQTASGVLGETWVSKWKRGICRRFREPWYTNLPVINPAEVLAGNGPRMGDDGDGPQD